jgi:hypothetical protein
MLSLADEAVRIRAPARLGREDVVAGIISMKLVVRLMGAKGRLRLLHVPVTVKYVEANNFGFLHRMVRWHIGHNWKLR